MRFATSISSGAPVRMRRAFHGLRTEGAGAVRETAAVALGVFIGCLPVYGFHLLLCWAIGSALGLNRLKLYLAANISNPLVAPWLLVAEIQAGAWVRRGSFQSLSPSAVKTAGISLVGGDLLVGSLCVGGALAAVAAALTYATRWRSGADGGFLELARRASDRYVDTGMTAWEFAWGKLRNDPVYRATLSTLSTTSLTSGGTLLDIGCGQGLALAVLAEAGRAFRAGTWPAGWLAPPRFERMTGIETRRRVAALARTALDGEAEIVDADARTVPLGRPRVVLLFDVLHLMRPEDQDALLAAIAAQLEPGGVVLVREADAMAGWRFTAVRMGNRLKALACGQWRQEFHHRSEAGWRACFMRHGFRADAQEMGHGTPFANVLFRLTVQPDLKQPQSSQSTQSSPSTRRFARDRARYAGRAPALRSFVSFVSFVFEPLLKPLHRIICVAASAALRSLRAQRLLFRCASSRRRPALHPLADLDLLRECPTVGSEDSTKPQAACHPRRGCLR